MRSFCRLSLAVAVSCGVWAQQPVDAPQQHDLFYQGMLGVPVYRIPALAVTKRGVVIAVCDARSGTGEDLPNDIDVVMRRSLDNGATWSAPQIIADFGKRGCGDSSLLVDRENGRLWCFFTSAGDGIGVSTSRTGFGDDTLQLYLQYSDDDGLTWTKPRNITADAKRPEWDAVWSSPGRGYQDSQGRLYFPHSRKSGDTFYSHFIFSDDHGETWKMGGQAGERTDEWMLVERSDGSLLANMRSNAGSNLRAVATSTDRGATWSGFHLSKELVEPVCQACLTWYDGDKGKFLMFSNPADTDRRRMTIRLSRDEGRTWPYRKAIHDGPAAYSCMAVLPDGVIGILYERGDDTPYRAVTFAKLSVEWLLSDRE